MRHARRWVQAHSAVACAAALLVLAFTSLAWGDAVPPPPKHCPPGRVPITSHGGPSCALAPPKNCPPGYRGKIGGQCVLHLCWSDGACGDGEDCRETNLCHHSRLVEWEYGEQVIERSNVLAAPPHRLDPPELRWEPKSICRQPGDCAPPAECRPGRICYPVGQRLPLPATPAASARPATEAGGEPVAESGGSETSPAETTPEETSPARAPAPEQSASAPPGPPPTHEQPSGCGRGCATSTPAGAALGIAVLGVVAALLLTRRRRGEP